MTDYKFILPWCPSVNGYWKPFRNRIILSKKGRDYRVLAIQKMKDLGLFGEMLLCNVEVSMVLNPPTFRKYDVDNRSKAVLDALTHAEFWSDDSQVFKLTMQKGIKTKGGNIEININMIINQ